MQEVAEPMFDLKVGIEELRRSRTLKYILATMLSVGNFLNGSEVYVTVHHDSLFYIMPQKNVCHFYFLNNFVKHWPILIVFGTRYQEET